MKISIVSDLHLDFWYRIPGFDIDIFIKSITDVDCDLFIFAGDGFNGISSTNLLISSIKNQLKMPFIFVYGNHDFYGSPMSIVKDFGDISEIDIMGLKIISCTFWTNFDNNNPLTKIDIKNMLADGSEIICYDANDIYDIHIKNFKQIQEIKPDIVITHHAPSTMSIHPRYKHDDCNYGFVSNYDQFIWDSDIKLWVHGHVHDPFDYTINRTRIVCNPMGYPNERIGYKWLEYKPKIVEI